MALPDYAKIEAGNVTTWNDSGATKLNLAGLAINTGQMGDAIDLGATWDEEQAIFAFATFAIAPTAGGILACYLATSHNNSDWPGTVSGTVGAYTVAERAQLGNAAVNLVASGRTTLQHQQATIWRPPSRYVAPVVINDTDQALSGTADVSYLLMIPRRLLVQDAA